MGMSSVLYGLLSALSWGAADFTGGFVSRRAGAFRVAFLSEAAGFIPLTIGMLIWREPVPDWNSWIPCAVAGAIGSFGLLCLYRSMSEIKMSVATPVSALASVILPVAASALTEGFPPIAKFAGFIFALIAIWLISQTDDRKTTLSLHLADLKLPLFAGVCFGIYFILIHSGSQNSTLWPLLIARGTGILTLFWAAARKKQLQGIHVGIIPFVLLNGLLDIGGNSFYILAGQTGRLDIAAVLGSLCPGVTILLAGIILHERLNRMQWIGILAAMIAIVLMTL